MKDFKAFLFRGNLIDLAVGLVVGVAFTTFIKGFVQDFISPAIAAIGGKGSLASLTLTIHHAKFAYGAFINTLIAFLIIAAVVYFLVVKPSMYFLKKSGRLKEDAPMKDCPECTTSIPKAARRCPQCTAVIVG